MTLKAVETVLIIAVAIEVIIVEMVVGKVVIVMVTTGLGSDRTGGETTKPVVAVREEEEREVAKTSSRTKATLAHQDVISLSSTSQMIGWMRT